MSQRLISRDPALKRLRDEGYDISITSGYLVVGHVPYVTAQRAVAYGNLACPISVAGDVVAPPSDHTMRFVGEQPCTSDGAGYEKIINGPADETIAPGMVATFSFSCKPPSGRYTDYYEKVTTYVAILATEAHVLDSTASTRAFLPVTNDGTDGCVFHYIDTASSRAGINATNDKLRGQHVAIVGLGGTGSHILDLVAKTWVEQIHLYDDDLLHQHNAFRVPGALSEQDLKSASSKVAFLAATYSKLRTGVVPHDCRVDGHNVQELAGMDFVFLALTDGAAKKIIVDALERYDVPFIDCGMGLYKVDDALAGQLRVTTSTRGHRQDARQRISFADGEQDEYSQNIQIAELNSLNATLAVLRWKKLNGFYLDLDHEYNTVYVVNGNAMINEDKDGMRAQISHEFVDTIPNYLEDGVVYVSILYATAVHRCCCGCGHEVVTPLHPRRWSLIFDGETISLTPSIGNWSFPCQSHYWIRAGHVHKARSFTDAEIANLRAEERALLLDHDELQADAAPQDTVAPSESWWTRPARWFRSRFH